MNLSEAKQNNKNLDFTEFFPIVQSLIVSKKLKADAKPQPSSYEVANPVRIQDSLQYALLDMATTRNHSRINNGTAV